MPDVFQMARPLPWRKQHHVDSHIITRLEPLVSDGLRCGSDPSKPSLVYGFLKKGFGPPRFHLDKGNHIATPYDEVDLTGARPHPARENCPAFEAKPPRRDSFSLTPPPFSLEPCLCGGLFAKRTHALALSSIARAYKALRSAPKARETSPAA